MKFHWLFRSIDTQYRWMLLPEGTKVTRKPVGSELKKCRCTNHKHTKFLQLRGSE